MVVHSSLFIVAISISMQLIGKSFSLKTCLFFVLYLSLLMLLIFKENEIVEYLSPLLIVVLTYELLPGNLAEIEVNTSTLPGLDEKLFGSLFGMPPVYFAYLHGNLQLYLLCAVIYMSHIIVPLAFALMLLKKRDTKNYDLFILSFSIVSFLAFLTYLFFPTASPWNAISDKENLLFRPQIAALQAADTFTGIPLFGFIYEHFESFRFGAFPSLHASYPILIQVLLWKRSGKKSMPFVLYPAAMGFAAVYLLHHYVVDVLGSLVYVLAGVMLSERLLWKDIFKETDIISENTSDQYV